MRGAKSSDRQRPAARRTATTPALSRKPVSGARPVARRGGQARKPRAPLQRRIRMQLPSAARTLAALGIVVLVGGLLAALNGPWLRVARVEYAGARFTSQQQLTAVLAPANGVPLLVLDTRGLAARLRELPAVARASVVPALPDGVRVAVTEKAPAFVWQTSARRLVGAADGMLIGEFASSDKLSAELAALPFVDDRRRAAGTLVVGDGLPPDLVATALRLVAVDPARLGSSSTHLSLQVDDEYGFILVSAHPAWRAAFGFYGLDPMRGDDPPAKVVERQVAAVRTLFAAHPEQSVSWVDARNPGKVYFRARG